MAVDKKTVNKGEKKNGFFSKVGNFFKNVWAKVKTVQWNAPVRPVIAWSVIGGVILVAAIIALLVC